MTIVDLDSTGQPLWQQRAAAVTGYGYICYPVPIAVRGDGAAFITEPTNAGLSSLTVAYPNGGSQTSQFPPSEVTNNGRTIPVNCCVGPPMVNTDGTVYLEYEVRITNNNVITSDTLYLYSSTNSLSPTLLSTTTQDQALLPGPIIPDGQGGILATWTISPSHSVLQYPYQMADVANSVVGTPYNLPFSPQSVTPFVSPTLVLGENGTAFASGSTTATVNGVPTSVDQIVSFNLSSGATNWAYQALAGNHLAIIASSSGNSLVAKTTNQSANDTLLWFDPTGAASTDTWSAAGIQYADNEWIAVSTSTGSDASGGPPQSGPSSITAISDAPVLWSDSAWLMPQQAGTSAAEPAFTLEGQSDCEDPSGRHIEYWLVNTQGRSLVTAPYVVFEHQTDHSLAPPNGVSPHDYSGQQDKFTDDISPGTNTVTHRSTQTFSFGQAGQRQYWVRRIDRMLANSYAPVSPPEFSIVVPPLQQATLNGQGYPYVGPCSGTYPPN